MIGAIIGDIIGSPYEGSSSNWVDNKNFPLFAKQMARFTDDTILTCATADAILKIRDNRQDENSEPLMSMDNVFSDKYMEWALKYPGRGYGSGFQEWVDGGGVTTNESYANGCMMRCSPIGLYYKDINELYDSAIKKH